MTDTDNATGLASQVKSFLAAARITAANGLTWAQFGDMLFALLRLVIRSADTFQGLPGPEKKAIVLEAAGDLFDAVACFAVPLAARPVWAITRPALRAFVIALASGAVEQLLPLVRATT